MWDEEHELVFGTVLPDNRNRSNGVLVLEGLMFIRNSNGVFLEKVKQMAEESGATTSYDFFKVHMADLYKAIVDLEVDNFEDFTEQNLTKQQQEVLDVLETELAMLEFLVESGNFIQMIALTYFMKERPIFRKPEVIAAAIFKIAYDCGALAPYHFTQAEIADLFDVSTSSMMKHADKLYEIVDEIGEIR